MGRPRQPVNGPIGRTLPPTGQNCKPTRIAFGVDVRRILSATRAAGTAYAFWVSPASTTNWVPVM
jgi:hypothetical protein